MTTLNTKIEYCPICGKQKIYIAFKPDIKLNDGFDIEVVKLQCIVCDKPKS